MAELIFKAFLSCSLAEEDKEVRDFFTQIIRSFDIEPLVYDYQEIGRVADKVKEHIMQSDCVVAIATRKQKIEDSDYWACSDWIQHEIAVAHAFKKPIAILFEDGVKMEGLLGIEERRERFDRQNLVGNIAKITKFFFSLRNFLERTYQTETLQVPILLRHYIHAKEEMFSNEYSTMRCEILMESLIDELDSTDHSIELEDNTPGLSIKPMHFDFVCKEIPSGTIAEPEILQSFDTKYLWKISFDPPIKKGDKVRYAYKIVMPNIRPFTMEELTERIRQGTYEYKEPICEACEWYMSYPTAELKFDFEFPEGYEIRNFYPDVRIGKAVRLKAVDEVQRIKDGNFFKAEKIFDKWTLSLHIPKPIQNYIYYMYYQPPKADEIPPVRGS